MERHRGSGRRHVVLVVLACALVGSLAFAPASHATVPAGFQDEVLTHWADYSTPTGLAATPDGRILLASELGKLLVYKNGAVNPTPAIDLGNRICTEVERGLSGVGVDPAFNDNHYVYLYYTYKGTSTCSTDQTDPANQPKNRLSRFVLGDNDVIDPQSETVLIDNIPSPSANHIAGDIHFGKDGYLYVSVGDGGCDYTGDSGCGPYNNASRDRNALVGKILRITVDGGIPPDNPFVGPGTARCNTTGVIAPGSICQETYAWGLRNPFRFAMDPNGPNTRFFIDDTGQDTWEEIDQGQSGADYGWNVREGHCATASTTDCGPPPAGMTNPIYDYGHTTGCTAITGGAFVPNGLWPSQYDDAYLFDDYVCGKIFQLVPAGGGSYNSVEFASGLGAPVAIAFLPYGSSQALYYLSWSDATLHRISFTGSGNRTPTASGTASPTNGTLPLAVHFDGSASSDPDGNTLSFDWNFGDGSPHATTAVADHTYTTAGTYTATLTVNDGNGGQNTQTFRIDAGNRAPVPQITSPASSKLFAVGEDITLTGSATDPEDGTLPSSSLTWVVIKHHATHIHPFLPPTSGNNVHITGPAPEDLSATTNSYLEIQLTATDSKGLKSTVTQDLRPDLVGVNLATNPGGLQLEFNGTTAPSSFTSWAGWRFTLNAPDPQNDSSGEGVTFVSWSDGGAQSHQVTTPASDTTWTANFTRFYARPRGASPQRLSLVPSYGACAAPNASHGAPLAFGSCKPPAATSSYATFGTPDSNGLQAQSLGYVRIRGHIGDPSTPQDEADIEVLTSLTDVLKPTLDDYVGELQTSIPIRLTDRQNGPSGTSAGTTSDFTLTFAVPCVTTVGTAGSTCSSSTSFDAISPGTVVESKRSIWQVGQVRVYDGGPDGLAATPGNTPLATQGLFAP